MNADVRTWVEAAVGLHVRDGVPLADTPAALVSQLLAEMLSYCEVAPPAPFKSVDEGPLLASARAEGTLIGLNYVQACGWAEPVQEAMVANDWDKLRALPPAVWRWITTISSLKEADWEALPAYAETLLNAPAMCPKCKKAGPLRDIGKVVNVWEPLEYGPGGALTIKCSYCGERLVLTDTGSLREPSFDWGKIGIKAAIVCCVGMMVLLLLAVVRLITR